MAKTVPDLTPIINPSANDYLIFSQDLGGGIFVTKKITVQDILNQTRDLVPMVRVGDPVGNVVLTAGQSNLITFDVEYFDTDNMWTIDDPGKLTIRTAGKYFVFGNIRYSDGGGSIKRLHIYKGLLGETLVARVHYEGTVGGAGTWGNMHNVFGIVDCAVDDFLTLYAYSNGANSSVPWENGPPSFGAVRIG